MLTEAMASGLAVAACNASHGEAGARVVDAFALAAPRFNAVMRHGYLGLINRAPRAWSAADRWLDRSPLGPRLMRTLKRERHALGRMIAAEQPSLLCSTYPVYGFMLEALRAKGVRFRRTSTS